MKDTRLLVSNIERFAIHDGPGIRTNVFLKGCPLRCPWCANPEAREGRTVLLYQENKCVGCGGCHEAAPELFGMRGGKCAPVWEMLADAEGARPAVDACLGNALRINGAWMGADEICEIVLRDAPYYRETNGGVTISGGEPLLHIEELLPMLERFREAGIHRAVETCGAVPSKMIRAAGDGFDLLLFDVKTTDPERFRSVTGGDMRQVLDNLRFLAEHGPEKIVVRIPVIPGFNHTLEDIEAIFSIAKGFRIGRVDLLPYHTLGAVKFLQMGQPYPYDGYGALREQDLQQYTDLGKAIGLSVRIGG